MSLSRSRLSRYAAVLALPAVLVVGAVGTVPLARAQEATAVPRLGVVETAMADLPECGPSELGSLPEGTDTAAVYAIVPEESAARYRVQEELAQVGQTEAVGETRAIIGQLGFASDGLPVPCSRFDVDMRTLKSDQARRDNYLYNNTLEAETYPLATFVLRGVAGLEAPLAEGEETTITLIGDLTLRDTTKLVAWEATVTKRGGDLSGSAATEFEMPAFNITPPSVSVVLGLDETVRLEIDLTAREA